MVTLGHKLVRNTAVLLYHYLLLNSRPAKYVHPDEGLSVSERAHKYNYLFGEHTVYTEDGYILTMFRLQSSANNTIDAMWTNRTAIFLMHGLLSSAADWITMSPNKGLAFILADNGYDVWLGNARGNRFSRNHTRLNPEEADFWKFSFHEIGCYDLPAKLNYITNVTGQESVYYVGHSQGTTDMFVMASERPEYIARIKLMIALAPVAFTTKTPALIAELFAAFLEPLQWLSEMLEFYEVFPHTEAITEGLKLSCRPESDYRYLCEALVYTTMGFSDEIGEELLPLLVDNFPAGSSIRQIFHYTQIKRNDQFRKYDYGLMGNYLTYGKAVPPSYNLSTNLPTVLIYSANDWLSTEYDVNKISGLLRNVKLIYEVPGKRFSHMNFLYGEHAEEFIYSRILSLLSEY